MQTKARPKKFSFFINFFNAIRVLISVSGIFCNFVHKTTFLNHEIIPILTRSRSDGSPGSNGAAHGRSQRPPCHSRQCQRSRASQGCRRNQQQQFRFCDSERRPRQRRLRRRTEKLQGDIKPDKASAFRSARQPRGYLEPECHQNLCRPLGQ